MSGQAQNGNGNSDVVEEKVLREGLRANRLSADALRRVRHATEAAWRDGMQAPPRRRWLPVAAAASGVFLLVAGAFAVQFLNHRSDSGALLGSVARAEAPGIHQKQLLVGDRLLRDGAELRVWQSLDVRGDALLSLTAGGNLRVAHGSALEVTDADTVRLDRGELYVDIPPASRGRSFVVETPAGEFRHVGTQFAVAIVNDQTRLRVREGSVSWHAPEGESSVNAGTELIIDGRKVTRRSISTAGREWSWAETLAPEIDIEDRPLQEFLEWFSRETGRRLVLADEATRRQVASIRMRGNVRGLTAMEALSAVMAATTLQYELPEGVIRVSSPRGATAKS